jgi:hypothetical protein
MSYDKRGSGRGYATADHVAPTTRIGASTLVQALGGNMPASKVGGSTLVDQLDAGNRSGGNAREVGAMGGIAGGDGPLPHLDIAQQIFGHTGSTAETAGQALGAEAGATGHQIASASPPNLHIAAHEATHVVQQHVGKITVSTKPAAGNPSTSRTTLGVGEKVSFTAPEEGLWRLDQKDLGQGQTIEWTAPDTGMLGNLVFEPYLTSPSKNAQASLPILVLAPSKVDFRKTGDVPVSNPGLAGVGMTTEVTVGPNSVSFGAAEWLEQPGPAEDAKDYFAEYQKQTREDLAHKPTSNWLPMGDNNNAILDHAWTKNNPKLTHPTDRTQRWWAGSYHWTIPNYYRVKGGAPHLITYVTQTFVMDDAGAITVTKGTASATSKPDNQLDGDIEKFPTKENAMGFLELHGRGGCVQAVMNYKRNPKADPTSVQNLIKALRSVNVELYTYVTCKNTFSWTDPDNVTVTANGSSSKGGAKKINTGEGREFLFDVNSILDLDKMSPGDTINLSADVRDMISSHPHSVMLTFPYEIKGVVMTGSDRYIISAFFR